MSKQNEYELTGSGSVTYQNDDGEFVSHERGDEISEKDYKNLPKRQKQFFEKVEEEPSELEKEIDDEFTKDELKDKLDDADVDYNSSAKKAELVSLYADQVHEEE